MIMSKWIDFRQSVLKPLTKKGKQMDSRFEAMAIELEAILAKQKLVDDRDFVKCYARTRDESAAWGLLVENSDEDITLQAITAMGMLMKDNGYKFRSMLNIPKEDKLKVIESARRIPRLRDAYCIQENGCTFAAFEIWSQLSTEFKTKVCLLASKFPGRYTQWVIEEIIRCESCGFTTINFHGYVDGYGSSTDDDYISVFVDEQGNEVSGHVCNVVVE